MLSYTTPSGTAYVENCWNELSPIQFIKTVVLNNRFFSGGINLEEYRLQLLYILTGYARQKKTLGKFYKTCKTFPELSDLSSDEIIDTINENLYRISEELTFTIRPKCGPEEVLEFFSPKLRELLKTRFPWEIYDYEMVDQLDAMAKLLKVEFDLNMNLGKNPIPHIRINETLLSGPIFDTTDGDIDTNLKAGQYLDAQEYFKAYIDTGKEKYLDLLIMALYYPTDNELDADAKIPDFTDRATKEAILFVFVYIQNTLINDPVFGVLFSALPGDPNNTKISLGTDEAIGQLIEAGYGTNDSIVNLDIRTFFNFQIMLIKKNINLLRSHKKNDAEIARDLNLPIETVQKL